MNMHYNIVDVLDVGDLGDVQMQPDKLKEAYEIGKKFQMVIMDDSNFMTTNRLEAFYDAIIAIIVTVLVLELPQPVSPAIKSIWAIKILILHT